MSKKIKQLAPPPKQQRPTISYRVVEIQFEMYLQRNNLDATKMSPVQYTELRRAFYASAQWMLKFLCVDVAAMQEHGPDFADRQVNATAKELDMFWVKELQPTLKPVMKIPQMPEPKKDGE